MAKTAMLASIRIAAVLRCYGGQCGDRFEGSRKEGGFLSTPCAVAFETGAFFPLRISERISAMLRYRHTRRRQGHANPDLHRGGGVAPNTALPWQRQRAERTLRGKHNRQSFRIQRVSGLAQCNLHAQRPRSRHACISEVLRQAPRPLAIIDRLGSVRHCWEGTAQKLLWPVVCKEAVRCQGHLALCQATNHKAHERTCGSKLILQNCVWPFCSACT